MGIKPVFEFYCDGPRCMEELVITTASMQAVASYYARDYYGWTSDWGTDKWYCPDHFELGHKAAALRHQEWCPAASRQGYCACREHTVPPVGVDTYHFRSRRVQVLKVEGDYL